MWVLNDGLDGVNLDSEIVGNVDYMEKMVLMQELVREEDGSNTDDLRDIISLI